MARQSSIIISLCSADDTLLFGKATEEKTATLKRLLDTYALVSGQVINCEKSSLTFSRGTNSKDVIRFKEYWGSLWLQSMINISGCRKKLVGRRREIFGVLKEQIWARINSWGEKLLPSAGREIMIKAVLQAILSYTISCLLLPNNITNTLDNAIGSYWWSGVVLDKKLLGCRG